MINIRKILRWGILALQLVAMVIFFVLPLFAGYVSLLWYVIGILQTLAFCLVYFRMAKKRRVVSALLMVVNTVFALFLLLVNFIMSSYGDWQAANIYIICIILAVALALFVPEKRESL